MNLADLNESVTEAILRAEALAPGSWEAQTAFRDVSEFEEAIASIVSAKEVEGVIARLGAISAALSAGEPLRALQLADRYGGDDLGQKAQSKLSELKAEAESDIQRAVQKELSVEPVRFHLRAA
jgi:hypothetical protein